MKKTLVSVFLVALVQLANAQKGDFKIGFRLAPGSNIAIVKDNDGTSSAQKFTADGYTQKEDNVEGVSVSFYLDYFLAKNIAFSTGLWFTAKNFEIRNTDGDYTGISQYNSTYLQIPILFKFVSNEVANKLRIYVTAGPTLDLRMNEKLVRDYDGAHYWNMSRNLPQNDPTRGRNASGKMVKLFNPIDITLYLCSGVSYEIIEKLDLFAGIYFNKSLLNLVNPKLRFAEPNQTKVNSDISWKANLVGMELGVAYKIK